MPPPISSFGVCLAFAIVLGCVDARVECIKFANVVDYCNYHFGFMLTYCPRACGFCGKNYQCTSVLKLEKVYVEHFRAAVNTSTSFNSAFKL